jgi:predicted negative regulator of RcsB-dependent stress response
MAEKPEKKQGAPTGPHPEAPEEAAEAAEEHHPALQWALRNIKPLIIAVSVIILAAAAYAFADYYQDRQLEKAKVELARILATGDPAQRAEELSNYIADAPESLRTSALLELAETYERQENFEAAADTWGKVAALSDQTFAIPAGLGKAESLARAGKIEQALKALEELDAQAPAAYDKVIKFKIADVAERAGELERALQAYRAVRKEAGASQQAFVDYKIRQIRRKIDKERSS